MIKVSLKFAQLMILQQHIFFKSAAIPLSAASTPIREEIHCKHVGHKKKDRANY